MNDAAEIRKALESAKTIAVVGCSPNPDRPSNTIARYLMEHGYQVIPVNPGHSRILGETCYRSLAEVPTDVPLDIVDVFRRSDQVAPIARQALARRVGFFFMQQGVVDPSSARLLEEAGIPVAMDRCILVEHASRGLRARNFDARPAR
jgi:predicted CoA-binding protein